MSRPLLLLSINNTRTRLLREEGLRELLQAPTATLEAAEFIARLGAEGISPETHALVLSSVVPPAEVRLAEALAPYALTRVSSALRLNFSLEGYAGRAGLGGDRIAGLAAAAEHFPLPAIILDLGTAVTVNVLDAERNFLGGYIAPGLRLFVEYLPERTAQLPRLVEAGATPWLGEPPALLGQDTHSSMEAGAYHGFLGQCANLLAAARTALGAIPPQSVIVTGGDAALFHTFLAATQPGTPAHLAPLLAFQGMRVLGRLNPPATTHSVP
jgi:type III pantothenate kinase